MVRLRLIHLSGVLASISSGVSGTPEGGAARCDGNAGPPWIGDSGKSESDSTISLASSPLRERAGDVGGVEIDSVEAREDDDALEYSTFAAIKKVEESDQTIHSSKYYIHRA